jgi:hypothetical protein
VDKVLCFFLSTWTAGGGVTGLEPLAYGIITAVAALNVNVNGYSPRHLFFFGCFPLESNFAHRDTRAIVGDAMEHHLRLGSAATTGNNGFELSFTIVSPELLLAEAATKTMATSKCV